MVKIRLTRIGRHKLPLYRIVVTDSRNARDGGFIQEIGSYDPSKGLQNAIIDETATINWLLQGALPSETIRSLLTKKGIYVKFLEAKKASKGK